MADQPCRNPNCNSVGQPHPNCRCYDGMAKGGMVQSACDRGMEHKPICHLAKGGFVLESEDDSHYVIKHPKGDSLRIAKKGLSPKLTEQIKKFAKGGEVKSPISEGFSSATGAQGIKQAGQNIKNFADGGMSVPTDPNQFQTPTNGAPPVTINIQSPAPQVQPEAPQTAPEPTQSIAQEPRRIVNPQIVNSIKRAAPEFGKMLMAGGPEGYVAQKTMNATTNALTVPNPKHPQSALSQNVVDTQPLMGNPEPLPQQTQQTTTAPLPITAMPSIDPEVKKLQDLTTQQQAQGQEMHTRAMNVLHDLNSQKIDFNRAFSNKSAPQKILAGIGMALSGIGSGITKQPNLAMEMINKEIERDVDEQKANIGKKATVLDGYIKSYGNNTAAANAYREDLQALVAAKMQQYSMKMQGNMMRGVSGGEGGMSQYLNFLRVTGSPMAKSLEERLVPGFGDRPADIPVPAEDREVLAMGKQFDTVMGELEQITKDNPMGSLNPVTQARAKALAADAKGLYGKLNKQGIFKESTKEFDDKLVPEDPLKLMAFVRTSPIYEETRRLARGKMDATIGKYWFKNPMMMQQQQQLTHRPGIRAQNVNLKQ